MNARAEFDMEGTYAALWHAERASYMVAPTRRKRSADPQRSKRQKRIDRARELLHNGMTRQEISREMGLAIETVMEYLRGL